jgi:hypothetical protein
MVTLERLCTISFACLLLNSTWVCEIRRKNALTLFNNVTKQIVINRVFIETIDYRLESNSKVTWLRCESLIQLTVLGSLNASQVSTSRRGVVYYVIARTNWPWPSWTHNPLCPPLLRVLENEASVVHFKLPVWEIPPTCQ